MASSSEVYNQIQGILGQLNPMLGKLPEASDYYKDRANEAFNFNKGPLENVAELEKKMYSMPGELMTQYDQEFGGKTGISSSQRINSILSQLGNQSGVVNVARGLSDQAGMRIDDMAETLLNQYRSAIEAKQMELSPLMSIWDRLFSEEQANSRAKMSGRGGNGGYVNPWGNIEWEDDEKPVENKPTTYKPTGPVNFNINPIPQQPKPVAPNPFDINPLKAGTSNYQSTQTNPNLFNINKLRV